jgi:hypothetical protein
MIDKKEISELFSRLKLENEKQRRNMLSQGIVLPQGEAKKVLLIEADNVTNPEEGKESDARLE